MEIQHNQFQKTKIVVVIPAYQPSEYLTELTKSLKGRGYTVIIVDDGSGIEYSDIWEETSNYATILHHAQNRGKGASLKTAFEMISCSMPDADCIVTADADGQHLLLDIERTASYVRTHPGALILGTRDFSGQVPFRSKLGNTVTRFIFYCISKKAVRDTQTGLRAFDRSLLPIMLKTEGNRYEYEMNVLLYCAKEHIPMAEVRIQTVYLDENNSCSHFDRIRDSLRIYGRIAKFASASLISFAADYLGFLIISALLPSGVIFLNIGNVVARIGSAMLNYILNAKVVFDSNSTAGKTLPQYLCLAGGILLGNCTILSFFTNVIGLVPDIAKLITELLLFIVSFAVQTGVIFKDKHMKKDKNMSERHSKKSRKLVTYGLAAALAADMIIAGCLVCGSYLYNYKLAHGLSAVNIDTTASSMIGGSLEQIQNDWGAKFKDHFSDTVISTDTVYKSPNISVEISHKSYDSGSADSTDSGKHIKYGTIVYYTLADIYVSSIECLKTAFAQDTYGIGYSEPLTAMSERMHSILSVNGDSYSNNRHKNNGTIIRNGVVYRNRYSTEETCVLYRDGTMKTYTPKQFDPQAAIDSGAWQTWIFGPSLLDENGKAKTEFSTWDYITQSHPRTAIGYYEPGHYCLLVVDGRQTGISRGMFLDEMSLLFEELGCKIAYNLDGGHCSFMDMGSVCISKPYKPSKAVSDGIFICEPEGKI